MGSGNATELPSVFERSCAPVYFVSGILQVDHIGGGNLLFTFFRNQAALNNSRVTEREVEFRMIAHRDIIPECAALSTPLQTSWHRRRARAR